MISSFCRSISTTTRLSRISLNLISLSSSIGNASKDLPRVRALSSLSPQKEAPSKAPALPPNLKLDYRSLVAPGKRSEKIVQKQSIETLEALSKDTEEAVHSIPASEPRYVIPLPQRLHIPIYHFSSALEKVGTIHLSPKIFGQDPIRTDILHRCVVYQRNKKRGFRNPGARTKTIHEVSGSGRKVRNQKGGGVARAGHRRPAHWKGGAKAHGPKGKIQNYTTKLNKKVKRLAILMGLSQKLKEGNLIVVNGFDHLENHKTKTLANALEKLGNIGGRHGTTAYLIDHAEDNYKMDEKTEATVTQVDGVDVNLRVASANMFKIKVSNQRNLNVYDMLKHERLVLSLNAVQALEGRLVDSEA